MHLTPQFDTFNKTVMIIKNQNEMDDVLEVEDHVRRFGVHVKGMLTWILEK
jgi:hypothetical protein